MDRSGSSGPDAARRASITGGSVRRTGSERTAMKNTAFIGLGVVLLLAGALWTFQGLGYVGGSAMTGVTIWAVIGPVVALVGLVLLTLGVRGNRTSR